MNRKLMVGIVAGTVVLAAAGVACGTASRARGSDRAKQFIDSRVEGMLDDIHATDAQRAQARALEDRLFDEGTKVRSTKEDVRAGLIQQWQSERPDPVAVHALVDRMIDEIRSFAYQAADAAIEFHQALTPEQRAELLQRAERHREGYRH